MALLVGRLCRLVINAFSVAEGLGNHGNGCCLGRKNYLKVESDSLFGGN
jgi:hypothetical protein